MQLTITSAGSGYSGNVDIKFAPPVGVGTTAAATSGGYKWCCYIYNNY